MEGSQDGLQVVACKQGGRDGKRVGDGQAVERWASGQAVGGLSKGRQVGDGWHSVSPHIAGGGPGGLRIAASPCPA